MPLLELAHVTRQYRMGDEVISALNDVSFDVESGELIAVMGSSGSGKSTLLNILGCLDSSNSGTYLFRGQNVEHMSDGERSKFRNREIGIIFQSFQLLSRATAENNVALPLVYRGLRRRARTDAARAMLERVGLGSRLQHRPHQLSGGQRQRVAIARALVGAPSLLLADEPTGNLDSKTAEDIFALFQRLHDEGNTIVVITHSPAIAARCPRAIHLHDGAIVADGEGAQVARQMASGLDH